LVGGGGAAFLAGRACMRTAACARRYERFVITVGYRTWVCLGVVCCCCALCVYIICVLCVRANAIVGPQTCSARPSCPHERPWALRGFAPLLAAASCTYVMWHYSHFNSACCRHLPTARHGLTATTARQVSGLCPGDVDPVFARLPARLFLRTVRSIARQGPTELPLIGLVG
jgi:hypothetical protein